LAFYLFIYAQWVGLTDQTKAGPELGHFSPGPIDDPTAHLTQLYFTGGVVFFFLLLLLAVAR
jgi:hypothetical protein